MREIKFRFWDTVEKRWMIDGRTETSIYDFAFKKNMNWQFLTKEQAKDRVIVEQYTGLKDKNGKEICEGDIVIIGCYNLRAVIKYEHCSFRMFHVSGSKRRKYCGDGRSELIFHNCDISTEIIGNVRQKPELLE